MKLSRQCHAFAFWCFEMFLAANHPGVEVLGTFVSKSLEHLRIGSWVLGLGPWARQSQMPRLDTGGELDVLKAGQLGSWSRADGYGGVVLKHSPTNQPLRSWMQDII